MIWKGNKYIWAQANLIIFSLGLIDAFLRHTLSEEIADHGTRLEIHQDGAGHVAATSGLVVVPQLLVYPYLFEHIYLFERITRFQKLRLSVRNRFAFTRKYFADTTDRNRYIVDLYAANRIET